MDVNNTCTYPEPARKIHAVLMIFGWWVFILPAIFVARYLRKAFPDRSVLGGQVWFQVHRFANVVGVMLVAGGLLAILIQNCWQWEGAAPNTGAMLWHPCIGLTACICAFVQPFLALVRCHPDTPNRFLFNWLHRFIGLSGWILACAAIYTATMIQFNCLDPDDLSGNQYGWTPRAFIIAYWIVVGLIVACLELHSILDRYHDYQQLEHDRSVSLKLGLLASVELAGLTTAVALSVFICTQSCV